MAFLEITDLCKTFGHAVVVERFNLKIDQGEFVSLLGPSGCGKTTTLRMVAGFERPTSGTIAIGGVDITDRPANRRNVGMVFQSYALFPNLTTAQNIAFGLKLQRASSSAIARRVQELLELVQLPDKGASYPWQLSGGQQQRVALARALAIEPQVLLLDEPLSALDAKIRASLRTQIRAIQRKLGITTLYVTHDQEEALSLSDRIVVMNHGRIEQIGPPFQIYNFPRTAFVAAFVGTLNILTAKVLDPGHGRIEVDGQPIMTCRAMVHHAVGEQISIAIRPEMIALDGDSGAPNRLHGVVEDVMFLGGIVRLRVRLADDTVVFDMLNNPHLTLPARDEHVVLTFPGESCLVLDESVTA